jgi:hypothetical protein
MASHNSSSGDAGPSSTVKRRGKTATPETPTESAAAGPSPVAVASDARPEPERGPASTVPEKSPRFHFFVIDSGWNSAAAKVLRENFHMIHEFRSQDPLFVLDNQQSIALLRKYPDLIGKDPILSVHDLQAVGGRGLSGYHGFRLCLGTLHQPAKALYALQEFLRFVAAHRHSSDIEQDVRKRLHRQGLEGAIEVVRESAELMAG